MSEMDSIAAALRPSVDAAAAAALERLVREGPDRALCRINALAFAKEAGLREQDAIAALLHAARLGFFDLSWNVLCPSCGGVLDANATLKTLTRDEYRCAFCDAGYAARLDDIVEVTFMVSPRVRRIAAHDPQLLSLADYCAQVFWSSGVDVPDDYAQRIADITLEQLELPPGEKAIVSLQLPPGQTVVFDPVTHSTQYLQVRGEPTRERQAIAMALDMSLTAHQVLALRPGPVRLALENRTTVRGLPAIWLVDDKAHQLFARRRPYLSAKRLLSNQTFRDIYRTDTLDVDQRLRITSLTFLFTDLKGSTELYERVGDLAAFDLVKEHFRVLNDIVASESGAVVKTIGDAVMATFPTPGRAVAAALRMRAAMQALGRQHENADLTLKIGIHEGPCLAVVLNDRQDYFGQTVNIAARVQDLADARAIFATGAVVEQAETARLLADAGVTPVAQRQALRGIAGEVTLYEIA
jgi:class 3 adenylate cyclase